MYKSSYELHEIQLVCNKTNYFKVHLQLDKFLDKAKTN